MPYSPMPDPRENRTLLIQVSPAWRDALAGLIAPMTYADAWEDLPEGEGDVQMDNAEEMQFLLYNAVNCDALKECIMEVIKEENIPLGSGSAGSPLNETAWNAPLIPEAALAETCDEAKICGAAVYVVDQFAIRFTDIMEEIQASTSAFGIVDLISQSMPVKEAKFLTGVGGFITGLINIGKEVWDASDSQVNRERMACKLYCAWRDCDVSFATMYTAIAEEVFDTIGLDITNVTDFDTTSNLLISAITQPEYAMFVVPFAWAMIATRLFSQIPLIGELGIRWWSDRLRIGYKQPSAACAVICTFCANTDCSAGGYLWEQTVTPGLIDDRFIPIAPDWMPANFNGVNYPTRMANTRSSLQSLRWQGYPHTGEYGVSLVALVNFRGSCTLYGWDFDTRAQNDLSAKSLTVYSLVNGFHWDNRVQEVNIPFNLNGQRSFVYNPAGHRQNVYGLIFVLVGATGAGQSPRIRVTGWNRSTAL